MTDDNNPMTDQEWADLRAEFFDDRIRDGATEAEANADADAELARRQRIAPFSTISGIEAGELLEDLDGNPIGMGQNITHRAPIDRTGAVVAQFVTGQEQ